MVHSVEKKVGQVSHRYFSGCLLRPWWDLKPSVQQRWRERLERGTGPGQHSQGCSRDRTRHLLCSSILVARSSATSAPSPDCSKLPCPLDCASFPSAPKIAKVTFAEFQAPQNLCLFQTSRGEQTRESQSVLSQLMQLIRIVLSSESKWISNEISPQV